MPQDNRLQQENQEEVWKMGLSDEDWRELLISIYRKKCVPFIGTGSIHYTR